MNNQISDKDKKDWQNFLSKKEKLPNKDNFHSKDKVIKTSEIDLHGFTLDEANSKVKEIVEHCVENKFKELLLITGKGIHSTNDEDAYISKNLGKLKYSVPEFLRTSDLNKFIISINDAEKKDGGEGAIIIKLKNL